MFNSKDLLGQLMGAGMAPSTGHRTQHAIGERGLQSAQSPLSGLLASLGGGSGQGGGILGSLAGVANQALGSAKDGVKQNNPLAIGGLGALAGAILGGGSGAMQGGALALLGSLAYAALNPKQGQDSPAQEEIVRNAPVEMRGPQNAAEEAVLEQNANILLLAMINAAKADGQISPDEFRRISGKLQEAGAEEEGMSFLLSEMQRPLDMQAMTAKVRTPELAAEVYAASLLAIEVDTEAERAYLRRLSAAMPLPAGAVQRLHAALDVPPV